MTTSINNAESGSSVRTKINNLFTSVESFLGITAGDTATIPQNLEGMVAQALPMTVLGLHIPDTLPWQPWMTSKTASWANEARSTGPEIGSAANATAAWALSGAAAGCVVYDTTAAVYRELTTSNAWKTTTRAGSRHFPLMSAVSWEAGRVIIWDISGQKPTMWRVTPQVGPDGRSFWRNVVGIDATCVSAHGGVVVFGVGGVASTSCGLCIIDFAADTLTRYSSAVSKSGTGLRVSDDRSTTALMPTVAPTIVDFTVNDVALTVLPDAPLDPRTGLPKQTIPVGTAGGLSVILHDGRVVDSADVNSALSVTTSDEGVWWAFLLNARYGICFATWADVYSGDGFGDVVAVSDVATEDFDNLVRTRLLEYANGTLIGAGSAAANGIAVQGLMFHTPNYADLTKGISALVTKDFHTGAMAGDIECAILAGTDDTDLVATDTIADRSVKGLTLTLGDSCTVQAVATGAELVSYTFASAETVTLGTDISSSGALMWWEKVSGVWRFYVNDLSGGTDYVDGAAGTVGTGLTISGTTLTFAASKEMTLARATGTIPTPEQIKEIERIERKWFVENAAITLGGTSNAVLDIAYDWTNRELRVLTSSGISVFDMDTWLRIDFIAGSFGKIAANSGMDWRA